MNPTTQTLIAGSQSVPLGNKIVLLLMYSAYNWSHIFYSMLAFAFIVSWAQTAFVVMYLERLQVCVWL